MSLVAATGDILLKSVLVATDFSEASDKALRHALAIARHYGAKLYLTHVVSSLGFTLVGPDAVVAATEAVCRDARQLEEDLVQRGALAGLSHEVIVRQGKVWEELEEVIREERVDLVVLGTHARRGLGKLVLGSVAEHIFRHAGCLVLTVGPGSLQDPQSGALDQFGHFCSLQTSAHPRCMPCHTPSHPPITSEQSSSCSTLSPISRSRLTFCLPPAMSCKC